VSERRQDTGAGAPGNLFVVSAPSGAGKTSLVAALVSSEPHVVVSVSHTTRAPRPGEAEGVDYHFVTEAEFGAMVEADAFLEHARVFDHRYGTTREAVAGHLDSGRDVVLEIDWQGARQVRERQPDAVGIFILPPSRAALAERLAGRGQDAPEVVERRMRAAIDEMSHHDEFDFLVINEQFDTALEELRCIVRGQRLRQERQSARHRDLIAALLAPSGRVR